jgi:hypothetical protein
MGCEEEYSRNKKEEGDQLFHGDGSLSSGMTRNEWTPVD